MECVNAVYVKRTKIFVRCGKCLSCLQAYHKAWIVRLLSEMDNSLSSYFITLTYSDLNYPSDDGLECAKREITLFLKRLRQYTYELDDDIGLFKKIENNVLKVPKIKYFLVSEYGSENKRLHHHLLLFNLNLKLQYAQSEIEKIWNKGIVHIGSVTANSICYVTDYMLKNDKKIKYHQKSMSSLVHTKYGVYPMPRYYSKEIFNSEQRKDIYERLLEKKDFKPFDRINHYNEIRNSINYKNTKK